MSAVTVNDKRASVAFDTFTPDDYEMFLKAKTLPESAIEYDWDQDRYVVSTAARFAPMLGDVAGSLKGPRLRLAPHLFDYQRWIVKHALAAKRYAIWADTGLGKTAMFLEWARHVERLTKSPVLILSPLGIIDQTLEQWDGFYKPDGPVYLKKREYLIKWCETAERGIAIANYDQLIPDKIPEFRNLGGIVLDESSILKTGGGKIKWNLIKSAKGIEYKLSCTATPAPNEPMEYASQAAFLEKLRNDNEILWTYFTRDKSGNWYIKPHAQNEFFRFMAGWSIYLRDPANYGFADILATLPPAEIHQHKLQLTEEQRSAMSAVLVDSGRGLFDDRLGIRERAKLSQIAKGFAYKDGKVQRHIETRKTAAVVDLATREVKAGRQVIIWTVFDEEARLISESLHVDHRALHGKTPKRERAGMIADFKAGKVPVLITKASMVGYGLNFQNAQAMVFSGFDDSFESMYQAIRRCYRFGQTHTVHVHVPVIPELEGLMLDNLGRKEAQFKRDVAVQEANYREALEGLGK